MERNSQDLTLQTILNKPAVSSNVNNIIRGCWKTLISKVLTKPVEASHSERNTKIMVEETIPNKPVMGNKSKSTKALIKPVKISLTLNGNPIRKL